MHVNLCKRIIECHVHRGYIDHILNIILVTPHNIQKSIVKYVAMHSTLTCQKKFVTILLNTVIIILNLTQCVN